MKKVLLPLAVAALLALPAAAQPGPGMPAAPKGTPAAGPVAKKPPAVPVYDESADAKAQIAAAVAKAGKEQKRVLVTLGANWCGWCRYLDRTFTKDDKVAAVIAKSYVPVKVDVGKMTKNLDLAATWGADPKKKGVPLLVILDGKGNVVTVKETESLESGKGHDPEKVIAFLTEYAGT